MTFITHTTDLEEIALRRANLEHRSVPLALRLFDRIVKLSGANDVAHATEQQIVNWQKPLPRNLFMNFLLGKQADGVDRKVLTIAIDDIKYSLSIHTPCAGRTTDGLLYFHGGGWVSGDAGQSDWWCSNYAKRTGALVVSFEYRLAPVHRFPAGLEDCYRALCWLAEHCVEFGVAQDRVTVAGDSAGGNLSAALCLLTRDRGGPHIARQILIYPATDLTLSSPSVRENATAPILSEAATRAYVSFYLGEHSPTNPLASPLLAEDLSGLPAALIQIAEHDVLRDDGWRYALRLEAAGVPAQITEYAGMPHGFVSFCGLTNSAAQALQEAVSYASRWADLSSASTRFQ